MKCLNNISLLHQVQNDCQNRFQLFVERVQCQHAACIMLTGGDKLHVDLPKKQIWTLIILASGSVSGMAGSVAASPLQGRYLLLSSVSWTVSCFMFFLCLCELSVLSPVSSYLPKTWRWIGFVCMCARCLMMDWVSIPAEFSHFTPNVSRIIHHNPDQDKVAPESEWECVFLRFHFISRCSFPKSGLIFRLIFQICYVFLLRLC